MSNCFINICYKVKYEIVNVSPLKCLILQLNKKGEVMYDDPEPSPYSSKVYQVSQSCLQMTKISSLSTYM